MKDLIFLWVGYGVGFIVFMLAASKKLRSNKLLKYLFFATFVFAIIGLLMQKNGSEFFSSAFFYIAAFAPLRYLYVKLYGMEPTYNRYSWYDPQDGRKQNWLDVVVFIIPFLLSITMPLIISIIKSKTLHFY